MRQTKQAKPTANEIQGQLNRAAAADRANASGDIKYMTNYAGIARRQLGQRVDGEPARPQRRSTSATSAKNFGTESCDGLPDDLKATLPKSSRHIATGALGVVIRLLHEHGDLDLRGLMIGAYNATGKVVKYRAMSHRLHRLVTRGLVKRSAWGVYTLTDAGKELCEKVREGLES